jgi:hypothetical protein
MTALSAYEWTKPQQQTQVTQQPRVVLYREDASGSGSKNHPGTVLWSTIQSPDDARVNNDFAVDARIATTDRSFGMMMIFRRGDSQSQSSRTLSLILSLSDATASVSGILMKPDEKSRGHSLAGAVSEVTKNAFIFTFSNIEPDRARNIQLLKECSWFDLELTFTDQTRAIVTIEKGPSGVRAFREAFASWGE